MMQTQLHSENLTRAMQIAMIDSDKVKIVINEQ